MNPKKISPLRQRFIDDMNLAGLTPGTQENYIYSVLQCAKHCGNIPPDRLTEQQVENYIRQRQLEVARGTFKVDFNGLKNFFYRTLGRDWGIFTKKKWRHHNGSDSPRQNLTKSAALSLTRSTIPSTRRVQN